MANRYKVNRQNWDRAQVRALRQHMGLTQDEMAAVLGVRQQTISEWETGIYQPRGTSATVLSIVAERAKFKYQAAASNNKSGTA